MENLNFLDLYIHLVMILLEHFFITDYFYASGFRNLYAHRIFKFFLPSKIITSNLDYWTKIWINSNLSFNFNNDFHTLYSFIFFF